MVQYSNKHYYPCISLKLGNTLIPWVSIHSEVPCLKFDILNKADGGNMDDTHDRGYSNGRWISFIVGGSYYDMKLKSWSELQHPMYQCSPCRDFAGSFVASTRVGVAFWHHNTDHRKGNIHKPEYWILIQPQHVCCMHVKENIVYIII